MASRYGIRCLLAIRSGMRRIAAPLLAITASVCCAEEAAEPIEALVPRITAQVMQVVVQAHDETRYGSAVLLDDDRAVTNCHVVGDDGVVHLLLGMEPQPVRLIAADRYHDLCLLSRPAMPGRGVANRRPSRELAVGEMTYAVGYASGRLGFSRGRLQARYPLDGGYVLRTGAGFLSGASGGGLFDARGRLVGLLTVVRRGGGEWPVYLAVPVEWIDLLLRARTRDGGPPEPRPPREGAASAAAQGAAPTRLRPFWELADDGSEDAPHFMQALRLETEGRWADLDALATRWLAAAPGDENALALQSLAQQRRPYAAAPSAPEETRQTRPSPPASAELGAQARLIQVDDAQCQDHGGQLVGLLVGREAPGRLRIWIERWYRGVKTADRTRHDLAPGAGTPLGCSKTAHGDQHWEIVSVQLAPT